MEAGFEQMTGYSSYIPGCSEVVDLHLLLLIISLCDTP